MSVMVDIQQSVREALKAGDKERLSALRMVINEMQKEAKKARHGLDEETQFAVLRRELKRREESIEAFRAGGREDLVAHEQTAAAVIKEYLPQQMDESELSAIVDRIIADTGASSARDMGKVMAAVMAEGGAQIDGKQASRLVKERLAG